MKRVVPTCAVFLLAASLALPSAQATEREPATLPVVYSGVAALANATLRPDTDPAGANDWSCRPSAAHPDPVVLVHGTIENKTYNWYTLAPLLHDNGYCVFALNYGETSGVHVGLPGSAHTYGSGPVADSAAELSTFVDRVLAATGAAEVDLVGHSQGGMMPRYYLKYLGGKGKVAKLVGLSPANHGSTIDGLTRLPGTAYLVSAALGPSVTDQIAGSPFLRDLNDGGETVPGVAYTVIQSRFDEVVTPYTSAFLTGPNVTDIVLQDQCPADTSDHLGISFDSVALRDVVNALDPAHAQAPDCTLTLPVNGGGYDRRAQEAGSQRP